MKAVQEDPSITRYQDALSLKSALEKILGTEEWSRLKDTQSINAWRKSLRRALKSSEVAIKATVAIADSDWHAECDDILERGTEGLINASSIREAFSAVAACYMELSFHQLGFCPNRTGSRGKVKAIPSHWDLGLYRSVQYVQTDLQSLEIEYSKDTRPRDDKFADKKYSLLWNNRR